MIGAHSGRAAHRGITRTTKHRTELFRWKGLNQEVSKFVKSCPHCMTMESGEMIPRPLGHTLHADKPNELIHFDYCYMGNSESGNAYVLILKDDLSGYVWLKPCEAANAESASKILIEWAAAFGVPMAWMSDQGSHFKNKVVSELSKKLRIDHIFSLPYCPWVNGTVEVVCREMARATRAIL